MKAIIYTNCQFKFLEEKLKNININTKYIFLHSDTFTKQLSLETLNFFQNIDIFIYQHIKENSPTINNNIKNKLISKENAEKYFTLDLKGKDIILNLDLDFFQPELDFISYDLKKKVVLDAAEKASIITIATSPFFIDQTLAIQVFKDIFTSPPTPLLRGDGSS